MNTLDYILRKYNLQWKGCLCEHLPVEHVHEVKNCTKCECEGYRPTNPIEIPNIGRDNLPELFRELGFTKGAEIGSMQGDYSQVLCGDFPELQLYCVDPWAEYPGYKLGDQKTMEVYYNRTRRRTKKYGVKLIRKFSVDAAKDFEDGSLCFVYIDGNHDLPSVINDIHAWLPKIKVGGICCGHDYIQRGMGPTIFGKANKTFHVKQAVETYTASYCIDPWFALGRRIPLEGEIRDKIRSWMFVKD